MTAKPNAKITERDLLDALNIRYGKTYQNGATKMQRYTRAEHVRSRLGFDARRTLDYIAVDLWGTIGPSRGPFVHGHEIKCSRTDWQAELKDPEKAEEFKRYMHHFWLVVSDKDIVRPGELPDGWGLMVRHGKSTRVLHQAPKLTPEPMPLDMHGALLRATAKTATRLATDSAAAQVLTAAANAYPVLTRDMVSRPSVRQWLLDRAGQSAS